GRPFLAHGPCRECGENTTVGKSLLELSQAPRYDRVPDGPAIQKLARGLIRPAVSEVFPITWGCRNNESKDEETHSRADASDGRRHDAGGVLRAGRRAAEPEPATG